MCTLVEDGDGDRDHGRAKWNMDFFISRVSNFRKMSIRYVAKTSRNGNEKYDSSDDNDDYDDGMVGWMASISIL